jgi:hypothetical protein
MWETTGDHVAKDVSDGLSLLQKAAGKNYGPALYEIAIRQIDGKDSPADPENGLETMRRASLFGSAKAQFFLGDRYETGTGVPLELDRARRQFRLCAAQGIGICQFRLARLLLDLPDRPERDYVQAVAWLQLASEQGIAVATDIASKETAKMTPAQTTWMTSLKAQLVRK